MKSKEGCNFRFYIRFIYKKKKKFNRNVLKYQTHPNCCIKILVATLLLLVLASHTLGRHSKWRKKSIENSTLGQVTNIFLKGKVAQNHAKSLKKFGIFHTGRGGGSRPQWNFSHFFFHFECRPQAEPSKKSPICRS